MINNFYTKGIGLLVLIGLPFLLGRHTVKPIIEEVVTEKIIVDTLTIEKLIVDTITSTKYVERYLPTLPKQQDTLIIRDSVKVYVPISDYIFEEPSKYRIEASGYEVKLNKLEIYPTTVYNTETKIVKKKPKFGIGVQVGYGISNNSVSPYVGIGLTYNIITF